MQIENLHPVEFAPGPLGLKLAWFPYREGAIGIMQLTNRRPKSFSIYQPQLEEIIDAHIAIVRNVGAALPHLPQGRLRPLDIAADFGKYMLRTIPSVKDSRRPRPIEARNGLVLVGYDVVLPPGALRAVLKVTTRIASNTSRLKVSADLPAAIVSAKARIDETLM